MGDLAIPWAGQHEYIQFAVYFPSTADRDNDRGRLTARLRQGTILRVTRLTGNAVTDHPTEKPVALLRQLIESSSCIGETVLDMFAGVGSTLVAARVEGRRAIGIELDERYCEIAARRLAQNVFAFSEPA
jgi:site-specific DNA-methyltransferase (adenine-specific)